MIRSIYKCFLTLNSILFIFIVFLIKENYYFLFLEMWPTWVSQGLYVLIPIPLSMIILKSAKYLSVDSINSKIVSVEEANNAYLPSYLGYFFVALSIPNMQTFIFVFLILFAFVYFSHTQYFNPVFLIFKYHFYYITTSDNTKNIVISKRILKITDEVQLKKLRRINYYTFMDEEVE